METSASMTFLKAFLLTNVVVLSRHAVAEGENSFSFVHLPTLCIHTSWFKRQQFNLRHEPILLNEMFHKCFISSLLCFCGAQFLLLLLFFSARRAGQNYQPWWTLWWDQLCQLRRRQILLLKHYHSWWKYRWWHARVLVCLFRYSIMFLIQLGGLSWHQ